MSRLLFNLHQVPQAEAEAVKQLLDEHGFAYYESSAGFWGTGVHGLWLVEGVVVAAAKSSETDDQTAGSDIAPAYDDEERAQQARVLIAEFQRDYTEKARARYRETQMDTHSISLWRRLISHPVKSIVLLLIIGGLIALMLSPFWLVTAL